MEMTLSVPIPGNFGKESITASVSADETFASEKAAVSQTELQTSTADLQLSGKDADMLVIKNVSKEAAEGVALVVRDRGETGTALKEEAVGTIAAGETKEVSVEDLWSRTTANALSGQNYLYCEVSQTAEEFELWNNSVQLAKESSEVPPETSPSPSPTPEAAGTPAPSETPKPSEKPTKPPAASQTPEAKPTVTPSLVPSTEPAGTNPPQSGLGATGSQQNLGTSSVSSGTSSGSVRVPGKVTGLKLKTKKKAVQAVWKKQTGADGYQLWYSTSKK